MTEKEAARRVRRRQRSGLVLRELRASTARGSSTAGLPQGHAGPHPAPSQPQDPCATSHDPQSTGCCSWRVTKQWNGSGEGKTHALPVAPWVPVSLALLPAMRLLWLSIWSKPSWICGRSVGCESDVVSRCDCSRSDARDGVAILAVVSTWAMWKGTEGGSCTTCDGTRFRRGTRPQATKQDVTPRKCLRQAAFVLGSRTSLFDSSPRHGGLQKLVHSSRCSSCRQLPPGNSHRGL